MLYDDWYRTSQIIDVVLLLLLLLLIVDDDGIPAAANYVYHDVTENQA